MKRGGGKRDLLPVRAEINVTSLVDVAFTLLVIFIITAPVLQGGVELNLPEGRVGAIESADNQVIVNIRADGSVFLAEQEVDREEFEGALGQLLRANPPDAVLVRADSAARYGWVFDVISTVAAQEQGVSVQLIAKDDPR